MNAKKRGGFVVFGLVLSLLIFFSTSLSASAADTKEIYEGDVISVTDGGTLSIFDNTYKFNLNSDGNKSFVDNTGSPDFVFINLKDCSFIDELKICFDRASGSTMYLKFYSMIPDLEVTHALANSKVLLGQENNLNVSIT